MTPRSIHYLLLCLIAGVVLGTNLGGPKLWDRDEPRNAGCAAEMLARGDWIVPVFNAELRTHKPVLLYWLIMASYAVLGTNELAARLPSAILSVGTVLCTYELGRRLFSPRVGLWAGLMLATSLMFVVAGRAATPDATLIFFSTLAVTVYVLATFAPRVATNAATAGVETIQPGGYFPTSWPAAATIYACMGFAVLAKGPVGLVLPCCVIGLFLLLVQPSGFPWTDGPVGWRQRLSAVCRRLAPIAFLRTCWTMRPLTAVAISLAVAAPWYAWVGWRTDGEFLRGFFLEHNLGRATQAMEGHRGHLLFYPLAMLVGFFPWSVFAAPWAIDTVRRLRRSDPWRIGYLLAIAWLVVYVSIFSLAKTKLPSYVTPCYPALALLVGAFLERWLSGEGYADRRWQYAAYAVFATIGLATMIAVPCAAPYVVPGEAALGVIGTVPFLAGLLCIVAVARRRERLAAWGFSAAGAAFLALLCSVGANRVAQHQRYDELWRAVRACSSQPRLAALGCLEPSWIYYGGWPIDEVTFESHGPTHRPWIEVDGCWVPKTQVAMDQVLNRPGDPFLLTTGRQLERVRQELPDSFRVLATVPLFLKRDQLVLLGRVRPGAVAERSGADEKRR